MTNLVRLSLNGGTNKKRHTPKFDENLKYDENPKHDENPKRL